jgi:hypothetical protein
MKKITIVSVMSLFVLGFFANTNTVEAKGSSYYKSASTGRFTTKSYASSNRSTTYKSYYR